MFENKYLRISMKTISENQWFFTLYVWPKKIRKGIKSTFRFLHKCPRTPLRKASKLDYADSWFTVPRHPSKHRSCYITPPVILRGKRDRWPEQSLPNSPKRTYIRTYYISKSFDPPGTFWHMNQFGRFKCMLYYRLDRSVYNLTVIIYVIVGIFITRKVS